MTARICEYNPNARFTQNDTLSFTRIVIQKLHSEVTVPAKRVQMSIESLHHRTTNVY